MSLNGDVGLDLAESVKVELPDERAKLVVYRGSTARYSSNISWMDRGASDRPPRRGQQASGREGDRGTAHAGTVGRQESQNSKNRCICIIVCSTE